MRQVPGFPLVEPDKVERLHRAGVLNLEMEMSVYLALAQASSYSLRAGGVCAVFTNRVTGDRLPTRTPQGEPLPDDVATLSHLPFP